MITFPKTPFENLERKEFWTLVKYRLSGKEFEIIQLRFVDLKSLRWISKKFKLGGRPQAKELIDGILKKIQSAFGNEY